MTNTIEEYIDFLKEENATRIVNTNNFKKFVNKDDVEGLESLGKALKHIKIEWELTAKIISNLESIVETK